MLFFILFIILFQLIPYFLLFLDLLRILWDLFILLYLIPLILIQKTQPGSIIIQKLLILFKKFKKVIGGFVMSGYYIGQLQPWLVEVLESN